MMMIKYLKIYVYFFQLVIIIASVTFNIIHSPSLERAVLADGVS